ncbi:hypothetical protein [Microbacterium galbinum]|uniref:hypothetical protein n=1 Tax=Microbacterium galbinum TaxID=2851646 RepID=UPI001FFC40EB|nr:hypothetical protein [Microbacterium galbinum]MCK2029297.1 hypothetical protein [Microbacterium galbinum]
MTDLDELRSLQRRAYGRDGGLTGIEAARLRELQRVRTAAPLPVVTTGAAEADPMSSEPAPAPASDRPTDRAPSLGESLGPGPEDADAAAKDSADAREPEAAPGTRAVLRRHWRFVTVSAVLLLALGIGIGWAVFAPPSDAIALTAEQQERRALLEDESDFDPGTLRAVGQDDDSGAIVWLGTKGEGDLTCAVVDVDDATQSQCQRTSDFQNVGINVAVMRPGETVDEVTAVFTTINAYIVVATDGDPIASIQQWDSSSSILAQFVGDERTRAEELVAQGFETNLSVVGYFRDEPVWMANRYGETVEPEACLIVDAAQLDAVCLPSTTAIDAGLSTFVSDDGSGSGPGSSLTLAFTASQTPYLTITEARAG